MRQPISAQAANWNGPEAARWVAHRDRHDRMLAAFADPTAAARAGDAVREALSAHVGDAGVRFGSALWLVTAHP